ncbi:MAG: sulfur-oxidizing protein SoxX [Cocleimonas sp.]|jgi:sulfur-oxidizing protein SoxX
MRKSFRVITLALSTLTLFGLVNFATVNAGEMSAVKEGKKIALNRKKGNCLACHLIPDGGEQPGNIGPPLIAMKARFPDKEVLKAQIGDPRSMNPNTIMPPFGAHGILTADELEKVTEYIHSL